VGPNPVWAFRTRTNQGRNGTGPRVAPERPTSSGGPSTVTTMVELLGGSRLEATVWAGLGWPNASRAKWAWWIEPGALPVGAGTWSHDQTQATAGARPVQELSRAWLSGPALGPDVSRGTSKRPPPRSLTSNGTARSHGRMGEEPSMGTQPDLERSRSQEFRSVNSSLGLDQIGVKPIAA
jgi:hypothetical protein